jgi:adenylate cyclase
MDDKQQDQQEMVREVWQTYLNTGEVPDYVHAPWFTSKKLRPLFLRLPAEPRCRICYYPFKGFGGTVIRNIFGIEPSRLNPHICNFCDKFLETHKGGAEVELTILFADVRGSTKLAENMNPTQFGQLINRFYNVTTKVLFDSGALVEKMIGDAVTGFYTPGFSGDKHSQVAIQAGRDILKATGHDSQSEPRIPVGIGIHTGLAYVGAVSADAGVNDITVLGDTANIGARLSSLAGPGEILISGATAVDAGLEAGKNKIRQVELKGRSDSIEVWVL